MRAREGRSADEHDTIAEVRAQIAEKMRNQVDTLNLAHSDLELLRDALELLGIHALSRTWVRTRANVARMF
jgi:hypothetical protein